MPRLGNNPRADDEDPVVKGRERSVRVEVVKVVGCVTPSPHERFGVEWYRGGGLTSGRRRRVGEFDISRLGSGFFLWGVVLWDETEEETLRRTGTGSPTYTRGGGVRGVGGSEGET